MSMLETQGLTRRFGELVAVDALTISVKAGEVFALLGANGAGKTVTMKMLTTLLRPSAGNARVAGYDIVHQAALVRRVIGYGPQLVSADGALTGYENLLIFAKLYDIPRAERKARLEESLAFMGLADVSDMEPWKSPPAFCRRAAGEHRRRHGADRSVCVRGLRGGEK